MEANRPGFIIWRKLDLLEILFIQERCSGSLNISRGSWEIWKMLVFIKAWVVSAWPPLGLIFAEQGRRFLTSFALICILERWELFSIIDSSWLIYLSCRCWAWLDVGTAILPQCPYINSICILLSPVETSFVLPEIAHPLPWRMEWFLLLGPVVFIMSNS